MSNQVVRTGNLPVLHTAFKFYYITEMLEAK